jgi:hypothetical protein
MAIWSAILTGVAVFLIMPFVDRWLRRGLRRLEARWEARQLDPRRMSKNEREPYWNREYARPPSGPATVSPRP